MKTPTTTNQDAVGFSKSALVSLVVGFLLAIAPNLVLPQSEKDKQQYDKLDREIRKNFDKSIAKFKPPIGSPPAFSSTTSSSVSSLPISSYDKFKDITTVTIESPVYKPFGPSRVMNVGSLSGYLAVVDVFTAYFYSGQQPAKPASFSLVFKTLAEGPLFGRDPSLIVIVDNKRLRLGDMIQTVKYSGRSAEEFVSIRLPYDTFAEIANGNRVEVQVGRVDFAFSDANLNSFRKIAGLPEKELRENVTKPLPATIGSEVRVANSIWQGGKLSAEFRPDGSIMLQGILPNRAGTWRQTGDRVEFELPYVDLGAVRALGVGVVKGNKMVVKIKVLGWFGGSTIDTVMQLVP